MTAKSLRDYNRKRDFTVTPEPAGRAERPKSGNRFVVQKHDARRLHYDFRLELDGVLKSWAVPKGPSLSIEEKRLAVQTEDHPLSYRRFEGTIPEGEYGAGPVIVWDEGTWEPIGDPRAGLRKGHLSFILRGRKLQGRFSLVRLRSREGESATNWLLLKRSDEHVREGTEAEITERLPESVLTGRTVEDVVLGRRATRQRPARPRASAPRSKQALPPLSSLQPQLATLADGFPQTGDWVYEIKYDGYRILSRMERAKTRLLSRNGLDWTARFPHIAAAVSELPTQNVVLDGEVCYVLEDGRTDFQRLQNALRARGAVAEAQRILYYVFDLLFLDGEDLRGQSLLERKARLARLLQKAAPVLHYSEHLEGDPRPMHAQACGLGLEGLIAKRPERAYRPGRGTDWLKLKCQRRQEFVIVGMTPPQGARNGLGALLLAVNGEDGLRFAGKVGTGFSERSLRELTTLLRQRIVEEPPLSGAPRIRDAIWVRPELVCEVSFTEFTRDGSLRHPSFEGLREDKPARRVTREKAVAPPQAKRARKTPTTKRAAPRKKPEAKGIAVGGRPITHPERVMDTLSGATKADLARYHEAAQDWFLPYARQRPLALVRCPGGDAEQCFFQKHAVAGFSKAVGRRAIAGKEALFLDGPEGLFELVQFNVVEFHGWGARLPRPERPDWMVLDLDPDIGLPFAAVVDAALELKEQLLALELQSFVKTTGGKGLHVVVPIQPRLDWEAIKTFTQAIAVSCVRRDPSRYVSTISKRARKGKIFVDYLRNARGSTAILPYSPRNRPGMTVAMPVAWKDLRKIDPREFTVLTVPKLLRRRRRDPWAGFLDLRQSLPRAALAALGA